MSARDRALQIFEKTFPHASEVDVHRAMKRMNDWDSLNAVAFFLALEREFKIRFSLEEMMGNDSLEQTILRVESKLVNEQGQ